jgi:hypothetical protein
MSTGELLRLLGRTDDETVWISTEDPAVDRSFRDHSMPLSDVDGFVERATAGGLNCWWAVQRYRQDSSSRKGTQVSEMVALYADLDWAYAGKPDGMQPAESLAMIRALSGLLETEPTLVVRSGHGLQPVWAIEPVGASQELLDWFKAHVAHQAGLLGVSVDTGVFNLSRVLRCPGSVNRKIKDGVEYPPEPASMQIRSGKVIDRFVLHGLRQAYPAPKGFDDARETARVKSGVARDSESDRVWTQEQADRYIEERIMEPLRAASQDGMWMHLWSAAKQLSSFEPRFVSEEAALGMLEAECVRRWGSADSRDWEWINTGWESPDFEARAATEEEKLDVFSPYRDEEKIAARQGGIKAGRPVSAGRASASAAQVAAADAAVASAAVGLSQMEIEGLPIGGHDPDGRPQPTADCYLPEEFWAARPLFRHLRLAAQSGMASPEGVLLAGLALVAARVMPNVKLPAPVGTPASLNHMFVLCGDSADGKSTCRKVAKAAIEMDPGVAPWHSFGPSSGQGIAGQFQKLVKPQGGVPFLERTRWAGFAHVEESDTMQALLANKTNTIGAVLRQGAFGEELSYGNIGDTQTNLPEHSYRLIFWMCMQPELSDWLLGTQAGGLPQRFVWGCVRDPRIVDVEHPGVFPVRVAVECMPDPVSGAPRSETVMGYTEAIRLEIREAARQRKILGAQAGEEFDGHAILNRFKIAGHIALCDGRLNITDEDWALAGMVVTASSGALRWVRAVVTWAGALEAQKVALGRGRSRVIEESVVQAHGETGARKRVADAVLRFLGRTESQGMKKSELRRKLQAADRHLLDEGVLDALMQAGQVRFEDILDKDGNQVGSRWYRT